MSDTFTCRIQYLDDSNPFVTNNFPEPTRPLAFSFNTSVPLINQIANVHSHLNAPLKVIYIVLYLSLSLFRSHFIDSFQLKLFCLFV